MFLENSIPLNITRITGITQLFFQQIELVFLLLKAQNITICTFCLCILSPYMFQPAWVTFRGRNASAHLKLLIITIH
jgi:hypothetical protein